MGLFDDIKNQPLQMEGVNNQSLIPMGGQMNFEEHEIARNSITGDIEDEELALQTQLKALAAEIAISGGGQATAAVTAPMTLKFAPLTWIGTTFSSGYAGNVTAQKIEGKEEISQGRAIAAGLINTIPLVGKFTKGSKATLIAKRIGAQSVQGGVMAGADTTIRLAIDEGRLPTQEEMLYAMGFGVGVGTVLGGSIETLREPTKKTLGVVKKIAGKTFEEVDALIKKGVILREDVADVMDEIRVDPRKPDFDPNAGDPPKMKPEEIGDVHNLSMKDIHENIDPKDLVVHADRLKTHPEIEARRQAVQEQGQTTLEQAGGDFSPEWQASRDWTGKADQLYGNGAPRKERKALIIAGGSASGKSTIANQDADDLGAKIIDSDFAKELFPEYAGGTGAGIVHAESKAVNKIVLGKALDNGDNIILPVVGSSGSSINKTIALLKSEGYEVAFKYVDIPESVAQVRNFKRIQRTGRFVDPDYITDQYGKISKNYETGKAGAKYSRRVTNENNTVETLEEAGDWRKFFDSEDVSGRRSVRGTDDRSVDSGAEVSKRTEGVEPPDQTAVREAIDETERLLVNQDKGKAFSVTRRVKSTYRNASRQLFDDLAELGKTGNVEVAKRILMRIDNYIELDRLISKKDYAQGSGLAANSKNAQINVEHLKAGITADGNQRTIDLRKLKDQLKDFIDGEGKVDLKDIKASTKRKADGVKLTKDEKLDAIKAHVLRTFENKRVGTFQKIIDSYFSVRLVQLLNSVKTATVGVPSALIQSGIRPAVNTLVNIRKAVNNPALKDKTLSRKIKYQMADLIAMQEYIFILTKHLGDTSRSVFNTIRNSGDSAFLFLDKHSYKANEIAEASVLTRVDQRRLREASRRDAARRATGKTEKFALNLKANILNNPLVKAPLFFYDYGLALIGGFEEVTLIAHSLRSQRAIGIKKAIEEGVEDVGKFADDYVEKTIDRSSGTFRARYDAEFADGFNIARKDHFRRQDLDPNDIRRDFMDSVITTLSKISQNPNEAGVIARILFPLINVPFNAFNFTTRLLPPVAAVNLSKRVLGRAGAAIEKRIGDGVVSGNSKNPSYNKAIGDLDLDIKAAKKQLNDPNPDVVEEAKAIIAEKQQQRARIRDLQITDDYEAIGYAAIGFGMFMYGYQLGKNGMMTGTQAVFTEDQKRQFSKGQGDPKSYKLFIDEKSIDLRYLDPIKGALALGADWAQYQSLSGDDLLNDDQTLTKFATTFASSLAQDMPTSRGIKNMLNVFSTDAERQTRGLADATSSLYPVPAEVRRFNTFDDTEMFDRQQGDPFMGAFEQALGKESANYKRTWLGEPKLRDAETLSSYFFSIGAKKKVELEPIDEVYLEDTILQTTISGTPTTRKGLKLKSYVDSDGRTLYDLYGELISTTRLGGKTLRQRLNALVTKKSWRAKFEAGYEENPTTGTMENQGIMEVKQIVFDYRKAAENKMINSKIAQEFVNDEDLNIYDVLQQRQNSKQQVPDVLNLLNIQ